MSVNDSPSSPLVPDPSRLAGLHKRLTRLQARREGYGQTLAARQTELARCTQSLALAPAVSAALETLNGALFAELVELIQTNLTHAVQEVLEQPIALKVERKTAGNRVCLEFSIDHNGRREEIIDGQGGSVANVLSVGLRLFALTTLPSDRHRPFLVLDEQDCWLHPDLVPRLVKIVHAVGKTLGFQVLMISHHDISAFAALADRVYRFEPEGKTGGVKVSQVSRGSGLGG